MQHLELFFGIAVIAIFAFQAIRMLKKAKRIEQEGMIAEATVSKIVEHWDADTASSSYTTYVKYMDVSGEIVESPMALTSRNTFSEGDKVQIRYIPGVRDLVRLANESLTEDSEP